MLTSTPEGLLDDGGRLFGPDERRGMSIPVVEEARDVPDEGADRLEGPAAHRFAGQDTEPRLDHVEPRGAGWREVEVDPGVLSQPGADSGRRMRRGVVEDNMQVPAAVPPGYLPQECQEVGACMAWGTAAQNAAGGHLQGRVQAREAMALVIVSLARRQPRAQGQQRLGATEGLDLRLLVDAQHDGVGRGPQIQTDHVMD